MARRALGAPISEITATQSRAVHLAPARSVPRPVRPKPNLCDTCRMSADDEISRTLVRLLDGYQSTQLLYVAAELQIADALKNGAQSSIQLASDVGAQPGSLHRILRALAALQIVEELPDGRFALTPSGMLLAADAPRSQRGAALARGKLYYAALGELLPATRDGGTPFELLHGKSFFEHLQEHPDEAMAFRASMSSRSAREARAIVDSYDFRKFRRLVDVGGGSGVLLRTILAAAPNLEGLLFDLPSVVAGVELPAAGGNFFDAVPAGSDAYVLSRVIHDWSDDDAVKILENCRHAMLDDSVLLLAEALLPERAVDNPEAVRMDLHMLTLLHGRERTEGEYVQLVSRAGLSHRRTIPTASDVSLIEVKKGEA